MRIYDPAAQERCRSAEASWQKSPTPKIPILGYFDATGVGVILPSGKEGESFLVRHGLFGPCPQEKTKPDEASWQKGSTPKIPVVGQFET